jgi:hypothetical protein
MKKETIVSSLISVGATAGALLISQKLALFVLVICVIATILVQTFWKEKRVEPSIRERAQGVVDRLQQQASPVQTQTANPSINNSPTFNNAPVFAPQIFIPPPSQPAAPAVQAPLPQEQPRHNVVFLGAAFVKLTYSGPGYSSSTDGMHSFSEVVGTSRGDMIGLVARFRNEAVFGQDIKAIRRARAHLKLFDKNSREIGTGFSAALWLGHPDDTFDLIPNARGGSVLVCWGSKTKANVSWKTRVAVDRLRDNEIELSDGYPSRAEVTIMDSNDRPLLEPIILEITKTKGELSVTAKRPQPGAPGSRPSFGR